MVVNQGVSQTYIRIGTLDGKKGHMQSSKQTGEQEGLVQRHMDAE